MNKIDAPVRFLLEHSPFSEYTEEEIDDGTYLEKDTYRIVGRIYPTSDIYKEGAFRIEMILTPRYPDEPPQVRFLTPIYHPNIEEDGMTFHSTAENQMNNGSF